MLWDHGSLRKKESWGCGGPQTVSYLHVLYYYTYTSHLDDIVI